MTAYCPASRATRGRSAAWVPAEEEEERESERAGAWRRVGGLRLTVDLGDGPVDRRVLKQLKDKGCSMWREVFIYGRHNHAGARGAAHGATYRHEPRGEVIGLLQGDGNRGSG